MARHIVARTTEIPPGGNKVVTLDRRDIVVFHVNGEFFALLNRCPHAGAPLDKAACVARLTSPEPGVYQRSRVGELLRCAWHGWEFDMRNGQSWFDPKRVKVRTYPVVIEDGETLAKGPYVAETFWSTSRTATSSSRRDHLVAPIRLRRGAMLARSLAILYRRAISLSTFNRQVRIGCRSS
jgi:nitrite reductase/ring-hydroxylating ferredoxin subunit